MMKIRTAEGWSGEKGEIYWSDLVCNQSKRMPTADPAVDIPKDERLFFDPIVRFVVIGHVAGVLLGIGDVDWFRKECVDRSNTPALGI